MISIILAKKIFSLFLIIFMGTAVVRLGILKPEQSKPLSAVALYVITPCMLLSSFQIEYTPEIRNGFFLALAGAAIINGVYILLSAVLRKPLSLDPVEEASLIYPNAGNLIIPIVSSTMGSDMVIYTCAYLTIQNILIFSHGQSVICGEKRLDWHKIVKNINVIAVLIGFTMFILNLRFPAIALDAISSVGSMIGPLCMLVVGMLIGGMDLRKVFTYRRVIFVSSLRLLAYPALIVLIFRVSGIYRLLPGGADILMISILAAAAPSASAVTQIAQVFNKDSQYASAINVVSTLLCILTIPVMAGLYSLLCM